MHWTSILSAILLFCLSGARASPAKTVIRNKVPLLVTNACTRIFQKVTWEYTSKSKRSSPVCSYEPAFQSMLYCIYETLDEKGYSNKTLEKTFSTIKKNCASYSDALQNMTNSEFYDVLNNGTRHMTPYVKDSANLTYPVEMDTQLRKAYYHALHGFYANLDVGNIYGGIICAYFVAIMAFAGVLHCMNYTPFKTVLLKQKLVGYVRGYLTLPTIGSKHASDFSYFKIFTGYLPTRLEGIIILGYLVLHTVFFGIRL